MVWMLFDPRYSFNGHLLFRVVGFLPAKLFKILVQNEVKVLSTSSMAHLAQDNEEGLVGFKRWYQKSHQFMTPPNPPKKTRQM